MTTIPSDILLHLWLAFILVGYGSCTAGIRSVLRRDPIARGGRP